MDDQLNVALLVLRLWFGVGLAAHGYNKVFRGGTTPRYGSLVRIDRYEVAGAAGAAGGDYRDHHGAALRRRAAHASRTAGMIGVMTVAFWAAHRHNGYFITQQGWEFVGAVAVAAWAVATIGPGRFSLDHAVGIDWTGWSGALIAGLLGVGSGAAQLAVCYRPQRVEAAA